MRRRYSFIYSLMHNLDEDRRLYPLAFPLLVKHSRSFTNFSDALVRRLDALFSRKRPFSSFAVTPFVSPSADYPGFGNTRYIKYDG